MEIRKFNITRGLPASGKSTFAKNHVLANNDTKRVNRDDLRSMLNGYVLTWENQALVLKVETQMYETILLSGYNIISDNMYLRAEEMERLKNFCLAFEEKYNDYRIDIDILDFTNVSVDVCIERDLQRTRPTTGDVIKNLHQIYLNENEAFLKHYHEYVNRRS